MIHTLANISVSLDSTIVIIDKQTWDSDCDQTINNLKYCSHKCFKWPQKLKGAEAQTLFVFEGAALVKPVAESNLT